MILSCQNIAKAFNEKSILKDVSFHIEDHDKAAIVGINGAGKTTLLRIITGELSADTGIVTLEYIKVLNGGSHNLAIIILLKQVGQNALHLASVIALLKQKISGALRCYF